MNVYTHVMNRVSYFYVDYEHDCLINYATEISKCIHSQCNLQNVTLYT